MKIQADNGKTYEIDPCKSPAYYCAMCDRVDCSKGFLPIGYHEAMVAEIGEE